MSFAKNLKKAGYTEPIKIFISSSNDCFKDDRLYLFKIAAKWNENSLHYRYPIKIIEWECLYYDQKGKEVFQKYIEPHILDSHLVIFLFCDRLGQHTKEEFDLVTKEDKSYRVILKDPSITSMHQKEIKWIKNFLNLKQFLTNIQNNGSFTGVGAYKELHDLELRFTDAILGYIDNRSKENEKKLPNEEMYHMGQRLAEKKEVLKYIDSMSLDDVVDLVKYKIQKNQL